MTAKPVYGKNELCFDAPFVAFVHQVLGRKPADLDEFEFLGLKLAYKMEVPEDDVIDFLGHFTLDQLKGSADEAP